MKMLSIKKAIVTALVVLVASSASFAGKEGMAAIMERIKNEKQDVNATLARLNNQQDRVRTLKQQCRESKSEAVHKQYKDAKEDLKATKTDLKKQERELTAAHQDHVKHHKADIRAQRDQLEKAQRTVDRQKVRKDPAVLRSSEVLMDERSEMRDAFDALERARLDRDKDHWVIKREYKDKGDLELQLADYGATNTSVASK